MTGKVTVFKKSIQDGSSKEKTLERYELPIGYIKADNPHYSETRPLSLLSDMRSGKATMIKIRD